MKQLGDSLLIALALSFVGCSGGRDIYSDGNPSVRQLQRDQANHLVEGKKKAFLKKHVGDRVEGIWRKRDASLSPSSGNLGLIGRAAAVSLDGYFLTAYHVVDDGPFYLYESIATAKYERDFEVAKSKGEPLIFSREKRKEYFKDKIEVGRIVWSDPQSDLALIKFDRVSDTYFEDFSKSLDRGVIVIAADDKGTGRLPSGGSIDQVEGNWYYFGAGKIVEVKRLSSSVSQVVSTMVARKGMSGSAITDVNGDFCGVLSSIGGRGRKARFAWSSTMTQDKLNALIAKDRQAK